jgi:exopolysaccharide biosynthesis polyprenyl glycosylphosphotransferase
MPMQQGTMAVDSAPVQEGRAAAPAGTTPAAIHETPRGPYLARRYRRWALAASDAFACLVALVPALGFHWLVLLATPLIVLAAKLYGLYDRDDLLLRKTTVDEAPALFGLATFSTLLVVLLVGSFGRPDIVVLWATLLGLMLVGRVVARRWIDRLDKTERCLFLGDLAPHDRLRQKIQTRGVNAELVARMNLMRVDPRGNRSANERELREMIGWTRADRVIIESEALPGDQMLDLVRAAKAMGVRVSLLPRVFDVVGSEVVFDNLDGMTLLGVPRFGLSRSSQLLKRGLDLAGTTVILAVVAPLMALIAAAIRRDSRGPVFFRQTRVGRDGTPFEIFKFRTMVTDAEAMKAELRALNEAEGGLFKITDDPRITRVGRLLRRTSLDELPQLLNVVRGDMSLVGPRPLVLDEDARITGWDRRRLVLTPGMTGHWQIAGSSRIPMAEMVKMDYLYVAGWSLWSDLKILLRTVPYVLARRGM